MKSKIIQFILVVLLAISVKAQPPNNTIFFGSTGDGFTRDKNVSASNAIFAGGVGDGFSVVANVSASNNIFVGGVGDGFNFVSNGATSNNIFLGGVGDGWNNAANISASNTIFVGGIGDGWNFAANTSASNSIFVGGFGDGWNNAGNVAASITFYPRTTATDLSLLNNWTNDITGAAGTSPGDFTSPNQLFNISRNAVVLNPWSVSGGSNVSLTTTPLEFGPLSRLTIGSSTTVDFNSNSVILRSTTTGTASIGTVSGTLSGATNVTMERWIKLRAGGVGRAYRLLAPTVNTTGTMRANWMEGGMVTTPGGTSNPLANYGTHITGAGGNTNFFDVTTTNAPSAYFTTNGVTPAYTAIGSTQVGAGIATMNALTGYFLFVRGDRSMDLTLANTNVPPTPIPLPTSSTTLRTKGTLLTGDQSFTGTLLTGNGNMNLVTNPYASPISWAAIYADVATTTNLKNYYTYWDANLGSRGGFVTVTNAGVVTPSSTATVDIQPGQAFFVTSDGPSAPTLTIKEAHKSTGNNNTVFLIPPESFSVNLFFNESNNSYRRMADGVTALYDNTYTPVLDGGDALEINNWDENIAIAREGKHLAIEGRPVILTRDTLPLFMNNMKQMAYEFEFTPAQFTNIGLKAELIDNFLGTRTLLSVTSPTVVSFAVTSNAASAATDRFKVVFGALGSPQGVDGITIKASQQNGGVQVDWTSKTETDMVRYEVEKQTYGTSYSKVNTTNALGNSTNPVNYNWFDANPVMGYNFYRIKGIDKAGNVRYSDMVKVLFGKGEPGIVVYPNPVEGNVFKVDLNNLAKGTYLVDLYNTSGQKVYSGQIQHDGSILVTKVINLNSDISKGVYQLQMSSDNGFRTTQKIIKN